MNRSHGSGAPAVPGIADRYEALRAVAHLVNEETDLQQVLLGVRRAIIEVLGFDRCGIFLVNEDADRLQGTWGTDAAGNVEDISHQSFEITPDKDVRLSAVIHDGEPYAFISDLRAEELKGGSHTEETATRVQENGLVAARARGKVLGLIAVDNLLTGRPFTEESIRDLIPFAEQAAHAIHNAQLLAESRRRADELEAVVYTISHDLRAPLVSIEGFTGGLLRHYGEALPPDARFRLARIAHNAGQLQKFISDVLAYSRAGGSGAREPVSLDEVIGKIADMLGPTLEEKGIRLTIQENLPVVSGVRVQLHQLFLNLIDNVIKHTGDAGQPLIEVGVRELRARWNLFVRDNGTGVLPEDRARVFHLFQTGRGPGAGHGVGLAIVKKIVEAHGGNVWVDSEGIGRGATFYVSLPKRADQADR